MKSSMNVAMWWTSYMVHFSFWVNTRAKSFTPKGSPSGHVFHTRRGPVIIIWPRSVCIIAYKIFSQKYNVILLNIIVFLWVWIKLVSRWFLTESATLLFSQRVLIICVDPADWVVYSGFAFRRLITETLFGLFKKFYATQTFE